MILYLLLFAALCQVYLMPGLKRRFALQKQRDFDERLYLFQLKAVRKNYPELQRYDYSEIDQKFRVRDAYYQLR